MEAYFTPQQIASKTKLPLRFCQKVFAQSKRSISTSEPGSQREHRRMTEKAFAAEMEDLRRLQERDVVQRRLDAKEKAAPRKRKRKGTIYPGPYTTPDGKPMKRKQLREAGLIQNKTTERSVEEND